MTKWAEFPAPAMFDYHGGYLAETWSSAERPLKLTHENGAELLSSELP